MGRWLSIKVSEGNLRGKSLLVYKNKINFYDSRLVILILKDLEQLGFPLKKIFQLYSQLDKDSDFPL